jgi:hypothetical protein
LYTRTKHRQNRAEKQKTSVLRFFYQKDVHIFYDLLLLSGAFSELRTPAVAAHLENNTN